MALTTNQLASVRSEIGDETPPTDAELDDIYDRVGTVGGVIYEVTSKRLQDLLQAPTSLTVPGEISLDTRDNVAMYEKLLRKWRGYAPAGGVVIHTPPRRWTR